MIVAPEAIENATPTQLEYERRWREARQRIEGAAAQHTSASLIAALQAEIATLKDKIASMERVQTTVAAVKPEIPAVPIPQRFRQLRADIIEKLVCKHFSISKAEIQGPLRIARVVLPRHVAIYLIRRKTGASLPTIGRFFGGRDHTTVLHALEHVQALMAKDKAFADEVNRLELEAGRRMGERREKPALLTGRYVLHEHVPDYLMCGWMWAADPCVSRHAALMIWPCECKVTEPRE